MIAVAAWVWGLVGIVLFALLGLLAAVVLGLVEAPWNALRRASQRGPALDEHGVELPAEAAPPPDDER